MEIDEAPVGAGSPGLPLAPAVLQRTEADDPFDPGPEGVDLDVLERPRFRADAPLDEELGRNGEIPPFIGSAPVDPGEPVRGRPQNFGSVRERVAEEHVHAGGMVRLQHGFRAQKVKRDRLRARVCPEGFGDIEIRSETAHPVLRRQLVA